jgi:hypothetical protein
MTAQPLTVEHGCPKCRNTLAFDPTTSQFACAVCGYSRATLNAPSADLVVAAANGAANDDDIWLPSKDLCKRFKIGQSTFWQWSAARAIVGRRNGTRHLYRVGDFREMAANWHERRNGGTTIEEPKRSSPTQTAVTVAETRAAPIKAREPKPAPIDTAFAEKVRELQQIADDASRSAAMEFNRADRLLAALQHIAERTWPLGTTIAAAHELVAVAKIAIEQDATARRET